MAPRRHACREAQIILRFFGHNNMLAVRVMEKKKIKAIKVVAAIHGTLTLFSLLYNIAKCPIE